MNDRDWNEPTRDEKRVQEAVRSLPRVEADAQFRQRLKDAFVSGSLGADIAPGRPPRRRLLWPSILVPAAAAVILIAAVLLNRGPALELADVNGHGTVTVEGRTFDAADREGIARALRPGVRVELSEGVAVDVVYRETVVYQLASATATVPRGSPRWFGKTGGCRLERGEVQALTGPRFEGRRLIITTPEGMIRVTGTLVSVVRDSSGTCVCVHRGTAIVGVSGPDMEAVPAGKRKVMFADGRPPIITDVAPPHEQHLVEFETKYRTGIRHPR